MNKLTTTLAGLALVAGASIAPAFAQGDFTTTGPFTFTFAPSTFSVTNLLVNFNPTASGGATTGFLSLSGGQEIGTSTYYQNTALSFMPSGGGATFSDPITTAIVSQNPLTGIYSIVTANRSAGGDTYTLSGGSVGAPVPEASTVISFGALLALGGLAVLRRKSVAKNAA